MTETRLNPLATYGLFLARVVHDAEELAYGPRRLRENLPALREWFPGGRSTRVNVPRPWG